MARSPRPPPLLQAGRFGSDYPTGEVACFSGEPDGAELIAEALGTGLEPQHRARISVSISQVTLHVPW